jgi:hypothetical protein
MAPVFVKESEAVQTGQHQVEQDQVWSMALAQGERFDTIAGRERAIALRLERRLQKATNRIVVFDDED